MSEMTVNHPIGDEMLMGYAAGSLPQAFDLVVASAVSLDDDARGRLAGYEAMGGALLEGARIAPLRDDSYEAVIDRILHSVPDETVAAAGRSCPRPTILPQPLREAVGGDIEHVRWTAAGMGVRQCVLCEDEGGTARLLSIPPGQAMPDHGHDGTEVTLVLDGAFFDGGTRYGRGDVEIADGAISHMPVADLGRDCICLVVTDGPLRFSGLLPRLAQRFLGI